MLAAFLWSLDSVRRRDSSAGGKRSAEGLLGEDVVAVSFEGGSVVVGIFASSTVSFFASCSGFSLSSSFEVGIERAGLLGEMVGESGSKDLKESLSDDG